MFERYTESARRTLFFARYEASNVGGVSIEPEHLLLGLIRESFGVFPRVPALSNISWEAVRSDIEEHRLRINQQRVPASIEIPFSAQTQRALRLAAEEADRLLHGHIAPEHLLLGVLAEGSSPAATVLAQHGLRLDELRTQIAKFGVTQPDEQMRVFERSMTSNNSSAASPLYGISPRHKTWDLESSTCWRL
jgi:ATP-dependent Clp protease ATP-binding subunit ClpC